MDLQGQRNLQLLKELERDPSTTQRSLAKKLGVALGLTNLYLKRLARKGYIKITTIPRNRIRYLLTPRGMAEKSRLTYEYMQYSLTFYRDMRERLERVFSTLAMSSVKRVVIFGTGELAELAYLSLREHDLTLVGFLEKDPRPKFLSYPVASIWSLPEWEFDSVLISDLSDVEGIRAQLLEAGIPDEKVVPLASYT